jgi:hypothetical protein
MRPTIKAAMLFLCFLLCAVGAALSPKETASDARLKTQLVPVNNHQAHRSGWLRV